MTQIAERLPAPALPLPSLFPATIDPPLAATMRTASLLLTGLVAALAIAGGLVPIGGAVVASGQVDVASHVKKVAHPFGGTVAAILVENGDHVRKGQPLVRLDDAVTGTDAALSSLTVDQLVARAARLRAEQFDLPAIAFPDTLARRGDAGALAAMADERRMFALRRTEQAGLIGQLAARVAQSREQIAGYEAQIGALRDQTSLIEPERAAIASLYQRQLVTIGRRNELERAAASLRGNISALRSQIAEAAGKIGEIRSQIVQAATSRHAEAGQQRIQIEAELAQQRLRNVTAQDQRDRAVIRAPYDGIVDKLAVATIGGVVRPAETVLEIVPDRDALEVEAAVQPSEIDQVHPGQAVRVRLSALDAGTTPELAGRVVAVAANRLSDPESHQSYFPVRIAIGRPPEGRSALKPGMPAEIFIATGNRSMLSYLTKPLRDQLERSFRDH